MKKLGLILGILAMASFVFAQTATVNQFNLPGTSSVIASVDQTGANIATITQTNEVGAIGGNLLDAFVLQVQTGGLANAVDVIQSVLDDEENAVALQTFASQIGAENYAMQTQTADGHRNDFVARYFVATQLGLGNMAYQTSVDSDQGIVEFYIDQDGIGNMATQLTQNEGGWAVGTISQYQFGNVASQIFESIYADADIMQDGGTNNAYQHFFNNTRDNYANVWQVGANNDAMQIFDGGSTQFSQLFASQMGDGSYANQLVLSGNDNYGMVTQYGDLGVTLADGNNAYQSFFGDLNIGEVVQSYGIFNMATQLFHGESDYGMIDQTGLNANSALQTFALTSFGNVASIFQDTDWDNFAIQYVEGAFNNLSISQTDLSSSGAYHGLATQNIWLATSTGNGLTITQDHGDNNMALQDVTGSDNTVMAEQHGIWWGLGENAVQTILGNTNLAEIVQIWDNNAATQTVLGNLNSVKAMQGGVNALATFLTEGMSNIAALEQYGDGSFADVYQFGDGNILQGVGVEFGENSNGSILDLDQLGDGHILNLSQTAVGGWADVDQTGVGNVATVIQN